MRVIRAKGGLCQHVPAAGHSIEHQGLRHNHIRPTISERARYPWASTADSDDSPSRTASVASSVGCPSLGAVPSLASSASTVAAPSASSPASVHGVLPAEPPLPPFPATPPVPAPGHPGHPSLLQRHRFQLRRQLQRAPLLRRIRPNPRTRSSRRLRLPHRLLQFPLSRRRTLSHRTQRLMKRLHLDDWSCRRYLPALQLLLEARRHCR